MNEHFLYARQPIFDCDKAVWAYELLYRNKFSDKADFDDGDQATAELLNNFYTGVLNEGSAAVTNLPLFFNVTKNLLFSEAFFPVKSNAVVIEILEDIEPSEMLLAKIVALKKLGYRFALDDYIFEPHRQSFLSYVDYIKIDVLALDMDKYRPEIVKLAGSFSLIAEKVEDRVMYDLCTEMGFRLFQGYFLAAPDTYKGKTTVSFKASMLHILTELQSAKLTVDRAADLIASDITLVFKLLKMVNSPMFPSRREITHLREAIIMLGLEMVKKWVTLLVLISESTEPPELFRILLSRAKACEAISEFMNVGGAQSCFTIGLLSGIGVALGVDTQWILKQLNIEEKTVKAILYETGDDGVVLRTVKAMEQGDWRYLSFVSTGLRDEISRLYENSCQWADELMTLVV